MAIVGNTFIPALCRCDDIDNGEEAHVVVSASVQRHIPSGEDIIELMFAVEDDKATAIYLAIRPQELIYLITNTMIGKPVGHA